jgi:hypothetical protein
MDEALKYLAGGGSLTALLLVYHVWKVVPALTEMKQIILQGQQIDLLKLVRDLSNHPEALEQAQRILADVNTKLKQ